jgi:hypothetical protein
MPKKNHDRSTRNAPLPDSGGTSAPHGTAPVPSLPDLFGVLVAYLLFAAPTVYLAIQAYTPCATNFEGGCSMGRGLMAMASLVTAAGASAVGAPLARTVMARSRAPGESATGFATSLLWALPLLYIPLVVYDLFFG